MWAPSELTKEEVFMRSLKIIILPAVLVVAFSLADCTQSAVQVGEFTAEAENHAVIPDKVFELGLPLLILFLVMNSVISILKHRADNQLKTKAIEKGISEETLIKLFGSGAQISTMQPLKWFLMSFSLGLSLVAIHFLRPYLGIESGYMAVGIILIVVSVAFYVYYTILKSKFK